MLKVYKYRIYPNNLQTELINKHIGSVRFLYNLALETKQIAYAGNCINLSRYDLQVQLKDLKNELVWLKEINSQSLQVTLMNLDAAYLRFFKGQAKFPKFKKKLLKGSFSVPQNAKLKNHRLVIPKFKGGIKIVLHRKFKGKINQATISRTPTNKYFASILIDDNILIPKKKPIKENTTVGVDLGIKSFLVASNGLKFDNPRSLKASISRLKYVQRKCSKYNGKRTKKRFAKLHEKVSNKRTDFLHKVSTQLIKSHDSIAIENLNINGMLQNHHLAQSISDVSWGMFVSMLEYKAEWYGKNILKIGRFDPSSKTCSNCGTINKELTLQDREWTCKNCDSVLDRDINASINIKNFALKNHLCVERTLKNQGELPTLVRVMTPDTLCS